MRNQHIELFAFYEYMLIHHCIRCILFYDDHVARKNIADCKFCKMVFKYDPANRNHHHKPMYCMMTDGHIYTLNHDVKRLEQKQDE